jgi:large subunit ribosomal protein L15
MPLMLRIRKVGFRNLFRDPAQIVNVGDLARFGDGTVVDAQALGDAGLVRRANGPVKILGRGEIQTALMVRVNGVSASARQKLEAAGGTVEILSAAPKGPKRRRGGASR